ncbi:hypothetical protein OG796_21165 [Streptomyces jietaisiensis]|uniref:DUF4062 domain-containing protein n=1 Tax=Streptomyces griseoaurantiacus TaxID=68213 RepID=A0ABZ1V484_9ACTN|nr:hypothetical protein [Streptomyces jietaisiensis]
MSYEALVLNVFIASPGDTRDARDSIERLIWSWNLDRSRNEKVVLMPLRWESGAVPGMAGDDPQDILNRQLVDQADIVIGLFYTRLGIPTNRADSGTVEEIERSHARGVPVHIYFSETALPPDLDIEKYAELRKFRERISESVLYGTYASFDDLAAKVRVALESDVQQLVGAGKDSAAVTLGAGAVIRSKYEYDREADFGRNGKMRYRNRRQRLMVKNIGSAEARNLKVSIEAIGPGNAPIMLHDEVIENLPPDAEVPLPVVMHMGVASQWRVITEWTEGENKKTSEQTVVAF